MKFNIWRLLCIALVFLLGFTLLYLYEFDSAARKNTSLLIEEKKSIEKKAAGLLVEKRSLLYEISHINKEKEVLTVKVDGYESKVDDYEKRMNDYEEKAAKMALEAENVRREAAVKDAEIAKKGSAVKAMRKMIDEYKKEITILNKKMLESTEARERPVTTLEPITVTAEDFQQKDKFKVIDVSREYGFVVIDAGSEEKIKKGDSLYVFRNETLLGNVVVEKVGEGISVTRALSKDMADKVKKGDMAGYRPWREKQRRNPQV